MLKQNIMLSYDLGVDGDYNTLYKWLDSKQAKECGDSTCMICYRFSTIERMETDEDTKNALQEIYKDLKSNEITFRFNDRIYVASDFSWKGDKSLKGCFIIGKRKPNPWDGFSTQNEGNFELE